MSQEKINHQEAKAKGSIDIRESMRVLPNFLQPFLTWLTAKPYQGQIPSNHTPIYHLVTALVYLLIGLTLSIFAVLKAGL